MILPYSITIGMQFNFPPKHDKTKERKCMAQSNKYYHTADL